MYTAMLPMYMHKMSFFSYTKIFFHFYFLHSCSNVKCNLVNTIIRLLVHFLVPCLPLRLPAFNFCHIWMKESSNTRIWQSGSRCKPPEWWMKLPPTLFISREIKLYYTTPKDGLNNTQCAVLNRAAGLICNYTHQNSFSKGTHHGYCLHCPLQFH